MNARFSGPLVSWQTNSIPQDLPLGWKREIGSISSGSASFEAPLAQTLNFIFRCIALSAPWAAPRAAPVQNNVEFEARRGRVSFVCMYLCLYICALHARIYTDINTEISEMACDARLNMHRRRTLTLPGMDARQHRTKRERAARASRAVRSRPPGCPADAATRGAPAE